MNQILEAFAGIDVAFAKGKLLPVCVCFWNNDRLIPLKLANADVPRPPRGYGNALTIDASKVTCFADETAFFLRRIEKLFGVSIQRIAIDAPSAPRRDCLQRRLAETALGEQGISYFATPSADEFEAIRVKVNCHLAAGGLHSYLPHANQLWMLVGFSLFKRLRKEWECLEVYPQATVSALGASSIHKAKVGGVSAQLAAVSQHTGWPKPVGPEALRRAVRAPLHDALDAYLSAWVAAVELEKRIAFGCPPDDVIWVPECQPPADAIT